MSDSIPLFGSRRKSYLILAAIGAALANLLLSFPSLRSVFGEDNQVWFVVSCAVFGSGCIAVTDVVADGIVVEETRRVEAELLPVAAETMGEEEGLSLPRFELTGPNLQSLCWGSAAVGGILSSYSSGALVSQIGPEGVYRYAAFLPLLVAGVAAFIKEEREATVASMESVKKQMVDLKGKHSKLRRYELRIYVLTLFLLQTPSPALKSGSLHCGFSCGKVPQRPTAPSCTS